ncbi:hypothetical protein CRG98_021912 [Punica granatum]|uniref:Uncharacterized protein n=1 Tax=Punica granatum TaxID=22663 RepID=A0A2I0JP90_PUNGR|nr:hypothetical protein CRG98_021912 [Punica granatum]
MATSSPHHSDMDRKHKLEVGNEQINIGSPLDCSVRATHDGRKETLQLGRKESRVVPNTPGQSWTHPNAPLIDRSW